MIQWDLNTLHQWNERWQMAFHTYKCFIMRVILARKNIIQHQYAMNGSVLHMTDLPRIILTNKRQWDSKVNNMIMC